jgi:hypothetical protein
MKRDRSSFYWYFTLSFMGRLRSYWSRPSLAVLGLCTYPTWSGLHFPDFILKCWNKRILCHYLSPWEWTHLHGQTCYLTHLQNTSAVTNMQGCLGLNTFAGYICRDKYARTFGMWYICGVHLHVATWHICILTHLHFDTSALQYTSTVTNMQECLFAI